ncbi:MAG: hypothetical protein U0324_35095 [Polyangiales bacterium]
MRSSFRGRAALRSLVWAPLLALALVLLTPARAEAKGFLLITHGDTVSKLADVPAAQQEAVREATRANPAVGYHYSYVGAFWIDLWTWGGEYCLFEGNRVWKLEPAQAAQLLGVPTSDLPKPLLYRFPPLLMLLLLAGAGFGAVMVVELRKQREADRLVADPRYAQAREILVTTPTPEGEDVQRHRPQVMAAAVQHLVSGGVDAAAAERDVALLEHIYGPKPAPTES